MKQSLTILTILCCSHFCMGQKDSNQRPPQELGHYWFVMYNRVQQSDLDTAARSKLTASHISYILSLRKSAKIIAGGAFTDQTAWIGFEIYNCKTREEVVELTEKDPLISSKLAAYEVHPWLTIKQVVTFN